MLFARFLKKTDQLLNICKQPTLKQLDFGLTEPVFLLIYTICSLRAFCSSKSLPHGLSPTLTAQGKVRGVIKKHTTIEVSSLFFFFSSETNFHSFLSSTLISMTLVLVLLSFCQIPIKMADGFRGYHMKDKYKRWTKTLATQSLFL